jgi:hypothetical protein
MVFMQPTYKQSCELSPSGISRIELAFGQSHGLWDCGETLPAYRLEHPHTKRRVLYPAVRQQVIGNSDDVCAAGPTMVA